MDLDQPLPKATLPPRLGRHASRSKNGCATCRTRKVKCSEQRPVCTRCAQAQLSCEWDQLARPRRQPCKRTREGERSSTAVRSSPQSLGLGRQESQRASETAGTLTSDGAFQDTVTWTTSSPSTSNRSFALWQDTGGLILQPVLSASPVFLSNSLPLSHDDLKLFHYIPESIMVLQFGKPWRWSMLSYVHSKIARQEKGVMRAFIAVAAMELRSQELSVISEDKSPSQRTEIAKRLRTSATDHYYCALQDLSSLLERISSSQHTDNDINSLFALWFLMLHVGLYDPDLVSASDVHVNGIRSYLLRHLQNLREGRVRDLPPASQQLLLFISYLEVNYTLGNVGRGQLFANMMAEPVESPISHDRIWQEARVCLPRIWGSEYPASEILDDMENYRGLSFLQECQKLKMSIWLLGTSANTERIFQKGKEYLWRRIKVVGEDFYDVLVLAKTTPNSGGRRVIWTVYHAALDYHAVEILFSCLDPENSFPSWLESALADVISIAYKAVGEDPRQGYRFAWPLSIALLKTRDPIHRDWIRTQVGKARGLFSTLGVPLQVLDGNYSSETLFAGYAGTRPAEEFPSFSDRNECG